MSRFLRLGAFLSVLFFATNVFAAGYSCPSYRQYTSCNSGYYMTLNGTYNATPTVGNACTKCPSGCECEGGTAEPVCSVTVTFKSGNTTLGTQDLSNGVAGNLTAASKFTAPVSGNGWTFAGWATSVNSTTVAYADAASVTFTADTTLYGVWKRTVRFTYYASASATATTYVDRTQYYRNSSTTAAGVTGVTLPALTTQTTYAWAPVGWVRGSTTSTTTYSSSTTAVSVSPTADGSQYFYALYSRTVTLSYGGGIADAGNTTSTTGTQYYNAGSTSGAVALNLTLASSGFTRKGCMFSKWVPSSGSSTQYAAGASFTFPNTAWNSSRMYTMNAIFECMNIGTVTPPTLTYNNGTAQSCASTITVQNLSSYTVTYSTSSTGTFSSTAPTLTNAGSQTVYYKVDAQGYTAYEGSYTCTMNRATGATTLGATSGTLTYPTTSGSFTASCRESAIPEVSLNTTTYASASYSSGTVSTTWKAADGTTTITVRCPETTNYNASSNTYTLYTKKAANPITISKNSETIAYPNTDTFTVSSAQGTLSVSSSAKDFATASISSSTVTVTSVKPGSATITVTATGNSYYYSGSKTYTAKVVKGTNPIKLSSDKGTITYPNTGTFTISDAAGTVTVTSGAKDVATVALSTDSKTATMTPVKAGTATITVTAAGNDYYNAGDKTYTLTVNRGTCSMTVSPGSATITYPITSATFTVNTDKCNGTLDATSSATGVATVSLSGKTGTVTWKSAGEAVITVKSAQSDQYNEATVSYTVKTQKGTNTLKLSATSGTLTYNASTKTKTFTVSTNTSGGALSVSSNATGVATAAISGSTVTATYVKAGSATITVSSAATSYYNAASATYDLTINCGAGYYSNSAACTICPIGKYTSTANTASSCTNVNAGCYADATGSTTACPKSCSSLGGGLYVNSNAGSDAAGDCYFTTTGGKYITAATDTAQTTCPAKSYCPATKLYYPNVGGIQACPDPTSSTYKETVAEMDWLTERCPTATTSNSTLTASNYQSWSNTGLSAITQCPATMTVSTPCAKFNIEAAKYNSTTGRYNSDVGSVYTNNVNAGYYLQTIYSSTYCNTSTNQMLYRKAVVCPANSYCPGGFVPSCSSGTYNDTWGANACTSLGAFYTTSSAGATAATACSGKTTAGKFVKTANSGEEACTCGGYCPGSVSVNYGSTGGKTNCTAGTYNGATSSSASSACETTESGYYAVAGSCSQTQVNANCWGAAGSTVACPNACTSPYSTSAKGSDDANDCYLTTTAKNYVKAAGAGQTTCAAGTYCPGGSIIYKGGTVSGRATTGGSKSCTAGQFCVAGVSAGTKCVTGSYSAAGASVCTACQDGKTTSGEGQTSCNATCSNAAGVNDWETASWATTNTMTNLCTIAATAGCSANYYKNNNACATCSSGTNSKYTLSVAGTTSVNSCYLETTAGKFVATKGAGETACISPYFCTGGTTVYYGTGTTTGGNSACTDLGAIYKASDAEASKNTQCYATTSAGKYVTAKATTESTCPAGDWCKGSVQVYYGSAGGNTDCPSGYTNGTTGYSLESQCLMSVAGGKYVATAKESAASGTCDKGYAKAAHTVNYGGTSSCDACSGATYAANTGQASCTACPTATNDAANVSLYAYWTTGKTGDHTVRSGCYVAFKSRTLDDGVMTSYRCYVDSGADTYGVNGTSQSCWVNRPDLTCNGGYYNSTFNSNSSTSQDVTNKTLANLYANACIAVGAGYWSADGGLTRTACASGLTTIGYGTGANEAADCGRKLHAGDNVIYLRSGKRGDTALNVKIGNQTFFGALSTTYSSPIKVKNGSTTYSVVNDWQ